MEGNILESTGKFLENPEDTMTGHGINKTFEVKLPRFSSHVEIVVSSKKLKSFYSKI